MIKNTGFTRSIVFLALFSVLLGPAHSAFAGLSVPSKEQLKWKIEAKRTRVEMLLSKGKYASWQRKGATTALVIAGASLSAAAVLAGFGVSASSVGTALGESKSVGEVFGILLSEALRCFIGSSAAVVALPVGGGLAYLAEDKLFTLADDVDSFLDAAQKQGAIVNDLIQNPRGSRAYYSDLSYLEGKRMEIRLAADKVLQALSRRTNVFTAAWDESDFMQVSLAQQSLELNFLGLELMMLEATDAAAK